MYVSSNPTHFHTGDLIGDDCMDPLRGIFFSPNEQRCILTSIKHGAIIVDVTDVTDVKHIKSYDVRNRVFDVTFHDDNERMVCASEDLLVLSSATGELVSTLREKRTYRVTFLYNPDGLLYVDDNFNVKVMDMNGSDVMTFEGSRIQTMSPTLKVFDNRRRLVTGENDGTLRVYDVLTGKLLSCFVDHRSDGFVSVAVHPSGKTLICGNVNKILYILKMGSNAVPRI